MQYKKLAPYMRLKPLKDAMCEECGVFGIFCNDEKTNPADATYYGLLALQHRGQESAGIAVAKNGAIKYHKETGLVSETFKTGLIGLGGGNSAIGHVRCSIIKDALLANAQPLVISSKRGNIAIAHNGNIINATQLRGKLEDSGAIFQTSIDSEIIASLIAKHSSGGIIEAVTKTMAELKGSYALVILTADMLLAVRDPWGIRPIALGKINGSYVFASESAAFDAVGAEFIRDLRPGEIVAVDKNGLKSYNGAAAKDTALCIFEYVYYARPDSDIDGIPVHVAREQAGARLAIASPAAVDVVAAVPDSATSAAMGYAKQLCLPYIIALTKNRYVGRTFIQPSKDRRETSICIKLNPLKRNVRGQRVLLVDDSIVRGTTSKRIVQMLKLAGAREVHLRISSPPVKYPCYFGIDTSPHDELIGADKSVEQVREFLGADSLSYLPIEDLLKSVEGAACNFCTGCFTGQYPGDVTDLTGCSKE